MNGPLQLEYDGELRNNPLRPHRDLWAQVLARAIDDALGDLGSVPLSGHSHVTRQKVREELIEHAKAWLSSNARAVGSFLWICSALDLDPGAVRAAVEEKRTTSKTKTMEGACGEPGAHD